MIHEKELNFHPDLLEILGRAFDPTPKTLSDYLIAEDKAGRDIDDEFSLYESRVFIEEYVEPFPELWEMVAWVIKGQIADVTSQFLRERKLGLNPDIPVSLRRLIDAFVENDKVLEKVKSFVKRNVIEEYWKGVKDARL